MKKYVIISAYFVVFVSVAGLSCRPKSPAEHDANEPESNIPAGFEVNFVEPGQVAETGPNSVAVTVNGVDMTEGQIEALIKPQLDKMAAQAAQMPPAVLEQRKQQLKQMALESIIIMHLLDEKVKAAQIVITEEDVNNHIVTIASQQKLSVEELKALVEASGQSFDDWKQQIQRSLGYQKFIESQFAGKIDITEEDAKKYYSDNIQRYSSPEQVRASHILIKPDTSDPNVDPNEAKAKAKAKTEELLKQIKDGADFAALAKANSDCPSGKDGGDLSFAERGRWVAPFEKAAFALKINEFSDIVETQFGYHIIKVTDRKEPGVQTFEQVKDGIIKTLQQEKQNELAKEYVESLKAQANIVYPPGKEPLPLPLPRAPVPQR